jgi:hypothetical protein
MKKTLIAAVLFGTTLTSIAQSDSSFVEVGMNVVPVFRSLQKENSDIAYSPYALTIEKKFKSLGLRLGAGYFSDSFNELAGQSNGNTDFVIDTTALDLRLGLVFYKNFKNNFSIKYGVDGIVSNSSKSYNTVFIDETGVSKEIKNSLESKGVGVAPFFFAQYHFTPNFSIGTEVSARLLSSNIDDIQTSTEDPGFNSTINSTQKTFTILPPTALFLIARF